MRDSACDTRLATTLRRVGQERRSSLSGAASPLSRRRIVQARARPDRQGCCAAPVRCRRMHRCSWSLRPSAPAKASPSCPADRKPLNSLHAKLKQIQKYKGVGRGSKAGALKVGKERHGNRHGNWQGTGERTGGGTGWRRPWLQNTCPDSGNRLRNRGSGGGAAGSGATRRRRFNYGLYAEQLSGSPFTAPHGDQPADLALSYPADGAVHRPLREDRWWPDPHGAGP